MGPLTFHVGSKKCGSTAIQAALTGRPVIPLGSRGATYVVLDGSGQAAAGREVIPGPLGQDREVRQAGTSRGRCA